MQLKNEVVKSVFEEASNKVNQVYRAEDRINQAEHLACLFNVHANFKFEPYVMPYENCIRICVLTEQKLTKEQFQELSAKASLVAVEEEDRIFTYADYTAFGIEGFDFQVVLKALRKAKNQSE